MGSQPPQRREHMRDESEVGLSRRLKTFRIVIKVRMHPRHATALVRVLLVLTHHQVAHDR
ncbi:hypothetical protein GCM10023084_63120 [Streptomyces lacrimifluminis]|uniref:Uncharacterized protein n=1 Tax=Streptomyces lacrimifluminis TaxID=1500077 RepID=A0A917NYT0_9ACTN|nr:hypothetical protein GCM10012282_44170 [Streptomyces lacrimifluminis]